MRLRRPSLGSTKSQLPAINLHQDRGTARTRTVTNTGPLRAECRARWCCPHVTACHSTSHLSPHLSRLAFQLTPSHPKPHAKGALTHTRTALACAGPAIPIRRETRKGRRRRAKKKGPCITATATVLLKLYSPKTLFWDSHAHPGRVLPRCHHPTPLRWPSHDAQHSDSHTVSDGKLTRQPSPCPS